MEQTRDRAVRRGAAALVGLFTLVGAALVAPPALAHPGPPGDGGSGYVALGDSYAAGEGLPPFEPGTDGVDGCHRSADQSYPAVLADSGRRGFVPLTSVACSGAATADLVATRPGSTRPPQLAALAALGAQTRTVTVTIGGNDSGFGVIFADCVYSPDPTVQAALRGGGPGCEGRRDTVVSARVAALAGAPGAPTFPDIVSLPNLLQQIETVAPGATIYLTGYPALFGTRTTDAAGCRVSSAAPLYVAGSDAAWIRDKATDLNAVIEGAAAAARASGTDVRYVDVAKTFRRHNLCDRKAAWLNGVVLASTAPLELSTATFHPTARGQRAYAKAVLETADSRPSWSSRVQPVP